MKIIHLTIIVMIVCLFCGSASAQSGPPWDSKDWPRILALAEKQPSKVLKSSFVAGDPENTTVYIEFKIESSGNVLLIMNGPGNGVIDTDPVSGIEAIRPGRAIFYIKDMNRDGIADIFRDLMTPDRDKDQYYIIKGDDMDESVYMLWNIGVAFTINKYLHNTERVFRE